MALIPSEFRGSSQRDFQLKVVVGVLLILFVWVVVEYTSLLYKGYQIELKKKWFIDENTRITTSNRELEKQYEYSKTDYFFRKEAKRKLNKKEPGEKVIIVTGGDQKVQSSNDWDIGDDNLQQWWDYLFNSNNKSSLDPAQLYQKRLGEG